MWLHTRREIHWFDWGSATVGATGGYLHQLICLTRQLRYMMWQQNMSQGTRIAVPGVKGSVRSVISWRYNNRGGSGSFSYDGLNCHVAPLMVRGSVLHLCTPWRRMGKGGRAPVILNLTLNGGGRLVSRSGRFNPGKEPPAPIKWETG